MQACEDAEKGAGKKTAMFPSKVMKRYEVLLDERVVKTGATKLESRSDELYGLWLFNVTASSSSGSILQIQTSAFEVGSQIPSPDRQDRALQCHKFEAHLQAKGIHALVFQVN